MKKTFLLKILTSLVTLVICTTFISCNNEDKDITGNSKVETEIIDRWVSAKIIGKWDSEETTFVFKSDGTGIIKHPSISLSNGGIIPKVSDKFTYYVKDNKNPYIAIILNSDKENEKRIYVHQLINETLTINIYGEIVTGGIVYTLTKDDSYDEEEQTNNNEGDINTPNEPEIETDSRAIDLGLSVKWASYNIGATAPEEAGWYFAWGETSVKEKCEWSNYTHCDNGNKKSITKYCTDDSYGVTDNKIILEQEDDIAHIEWGDTWRMPTLEEIQELLMFCDWKEEECNGVKGYRVTSLNNGNSIFLPYAGFQGRSGIKDLGKVGRYWSSSLNTENPTKSNSLFFNDSDNKESNFDRYFGHSIRAVCD